MNKEMLNSKLIELNNSVNDAIKRRSEFLNENMKYFAEFQIGEKVYNCSNNTIGICSKHYRFHENNIEYDTYLYCDCEIKTSRGCYDNTSRYGGLHPWIKYEEYENKTDAYLRKLEMLTCGKSLSGYCI